MLHSVKTFNGHNINDSNYRCYLLNPHSIPDASPVFLDEPEADSVDAGTYSVNVQNKVLSIKILNYANRYALIAQLKTWFKRGTIGDIIVTFIDDGVDYQMTARVINIVQDNDHWTITLQTGTSTWRAVTETIESTWNVSGATATHNITVGGKDETFLSFKISPSAGPSGDYLYQQIYRLPNTPGIAHGLIPWCITVNTAALVTAGKMQADCDDLRFVDMNTGQELKRWIVNPNTTTTKVWVNLDLALGFSFVLATSVVGTGDITELQFAVTNDNKLAINRMPRTGIVYHGNEWFAYSNTDANNCKLIISTRGLFGTTKESHTAGSGTFLYIQYPLLMKYGNSSVASPASTDANYDLTKPNIDLVNSSNTTWIYGGDYFFGDATTSSRTAAWKATLRSLSSLSKLFWYKITDVASFPAVGAIAALVSNQTNAAENAELTATLYRAAGITSITVTGYKYTTSYWITAAMRSSLDGVNFSNVFTEAAPTVGVLTNLTNNSTPFSLATGSKYIQLYFSGLTPVVAKNQCVLELLTCSASFNSSNIPTGTLLGEVGGYPLAATLKNETTGDQVTLNYMMAINKPISIDGETNIVQYDSYNAFGALTLDDEGRSVYIRLQGGVTNTIRVSAPSDLGTIAIDLHWFARRL